MGPGFDAERRRHLPMVDSTQRRGIRRSGDGNSWRNSVLAESPQTSLVGMVGSQCGGLVGIHDVKLHQPGAGTGKEWFLVDLPFLGSNDGGLLCHVNHAGWRGGQTSDAKVFNAFDVQSWIETGSGIAMTSTAASSSTSGDIFATKNHCCVAGDD